MKGKDFAQEKEIFAVIDQHFAFEMPELVEKVCETFADKVIWEAPARNVVLTDHDQILEHYRQIVAGICEPVHMIPLRRFAVGNQAFDDRIIEFTAGQNNVWGISAGKRVHLRLVHYFQIEQKKICHEIGYELVRIIS